MHPPGMRGTHDEVLRKEALIYGPSAVLGDHHRPTKSKNSATKKVSPTSTISIAPRSKTESSVSTSTKMRKDGVKTIPAGVSSVVSLRSKRRLSKPRHHAASGVGTSLSGAASDDSSVEDRRAKALEDGGCDGCETKAWNAAKPALKIGYVECVGGSTSGSAANNTVGSGSPDGSAAPPAEEPDFIFASAPKPTSSSSLQVVQGASVEDFCDTKFSSAILGQLKFGPHSPASIGGGASSSNGKIKLDNGIQSLREGVSIGGQSGAKIRLASVVELEIAYNEKGVGFYLAPWSSSATRSKKLCAGVVFSKPMPRILSCAHCAAHATSIKVRQGGRYDIPAQVTDISHDLDLSMLAVKDQSFWDDPGLEALDFEQFKGFPELFSDVLLIGYPLGETSVSITKGITSRIDEREPASDQPINIAKSSPSYVVNVWVDAAMNSGNSGGPAFDSSGNLLGIAYAGVPGHQGAGFIVPNILVRNFIDASNIRPRALLEATNGALQAAVEQASGGAATGAAAGGTTPQEGGGGVGVVTEPDSDVAGGANNNTGAVPMDSLKLRNDAGAAGQTAETSPPNAQTESVLEGDGAVAGSYTALGALMADTGSGKVLTKRGRGRAVEGVEAIAARLAQLGLSIGDLREIRDAVARRLRQDVAQLGSSSFGVDRSSVSGRGSGGVRLEDAGPPPQQSFSRDGVVSSARQSSFVETRGVGNWLTSFFTGGEKPQSALQDAFNAQGVDVAGPVPLVSEQAINPEGRPVVVVNSDSPDALQKVLSSDDADSVKLSLRDQLRGMGETPALSPPLDDHASSRRGGESTFSERGSTEVDPFAESDVFDVRPGTNKRSRAAARHREEMSALSSLQSRIRQLEDRLRDSFKTQRVQGFGDVDRGGQVPLPGRPVRRNSEPKNMRGARSEESVAKISRSRLEDGSRPHDRPADEVTVSESNKKGMIAQIVAAPTTAIRDLHVEKADHPSAPSARTSSNESPENGSGADEDHDDVVPSTSSSFHEATGVDETRHREQGDPKGGVTAVELSPRDKRLVAAEMQVRPRERDLIGSDFEENGEELLADEDAHDFGSSLLERRAHLLMDALEERNGRYTAGLEAIQDSSTSEQEDGGGPAPRLMRADSPRRSTGPAFSSSMLEIPASSDMLGRARRYAADVAGAEDVMLPSTTGRGGPPLSSLKDRLLAVLLPIASSSPSAMLEHDAVSIVGPDGQGTLDPTSSRGGGSFASQARALEQIALMLSLLRSIEKRFGKDNDETGFAKQALDQQRAERTETAMRGENKPAARPIPKECGEDGLACYTDQPGFAINEPFKGWMGVPALGFSYRNLEGKEMRKFTGSANGGVQVRAVSPFSPLFGQLLPGDIVVGIRALGILYPVNGQGLVNFSPQQWTAAVAAAGQNNWMSLQQTERPAVDENAGAATLAAGGADKPSVEVTVPPEKTGAPTGGGVVPPPVPPSGAGSSSGAGGGAGASGGAGGAAPAATTPGAGAPPTPADAPGGGVPPPPETAGATSASFLESTDPVDLSKNAPDTNAAQVNVNFEVLISSLPVNAPYAELKFQRPQPKGPAWPLKITSRHRSGAPFGSIPALVPRFNDEPCLPEHVPVFKDYCHPALAQARISRGLALQPAHYVVLGGHLWTVVSNELLSITQDVMSPGTQWKLERWKSANDEMPVGEVIACLQRSCHGRSYMSSSC